MRSTTRGRVCPAFFRAPCFGALLLPPTRLSVVGAYAIAATTALIADVLLPLERDELGTGQHACRRACYGRGSGERGTSRMVRRNRQTGNERFVVQRNDPDL